MRSKPAFDKDGQPVKRRAYSRKPKTGKPGAEAVPESGTATEGGENATAKPRPRSPRKRAPQQAGPSVFGVHTALYDHLQQKVKIADIARKHLEGLQNEISKLGGDYADVGQRIISVMAQACTDSLFAKEQQKPVAQVAHVAPEPPKKEPAKDA